MNLTLTSLEFAQLVRDLQNGTDANIDSVKLWPDIDEDKLVDESRPENPWRDVTHFSENMDTTLPVADMNTCHIINALRKVMQSENCHELLENTEFYAFVTTLAERFLKDPEPVTETSTGNCYADTLREVGTAKAGSIR